MFCTRTSRVKALVCLPVVKGERAAWRDGRRVQYLLRPLGADLLHPVHTFNYQVPVPRKGLKGTQCGKGQGRGLYSTGSKNTGSEPDVRVQIPDLASWVAFEQGAYTACVYASFRV